MSEIRIRETSLLTAHCVASSVRALCQVAGTLSELRKRRHYESPSVKRRKKSEAARAKKKKFR